LPTDEQRRGAPATIASRTEETDAPVLICARAMPLMRRLPDMPLLAKTQRAPLPRWYAPMRMLRCPDRQRPRIILLIRLRFFADILPCAPYAPCGAVSILKHLRHDVTACAARQADERRHKPLLIPCAKWKY